MKARGDKQNSILLEFTSSEPDIQTIYGTYDISSIIHRTGLGPPYRVENSTGLHILGPQVHIFLAHIFGSHALFTFVGSYFCSNNLFTILVQNIRLISLFTYFFQLTFMRL